MRLEKITTSLDKIKALMKKVIILAYDFPPYVSVSGLRPYSWYKYMAQFGIYPIVVTRQWSNEFGDYRDFVSPGYSSQTVIEKSEKGTIIKTPYKPNLSNRLLLKYGEEKYRLVRKVISAFYEFTQFIFIVGPKKQLYFEAKKYLEKNEIDLIIATGEPFVLFKFASQLSKNFDIPWIADYRDTWTQNIDASNYLLKKKWESFFEKKYLENARLITTVSQVFKKNISSLLPSKEYRIIPNGYDSEYVDNAEKISQGNKKMSIAFVGAIYDWHPIKSFFRVCCDFVKQLDNPDFQLNFYGLNQSHFKWDVSEMVKTEFPELISYIKIHPKIPNEKLLQKLATDNLFLLFNYYAYMGTKIYDYLGLRRNILLCYSDDNEANELRKKYYNLSGDNFLEQRVQEKLIAETNAGIVVKDSSHLKKVINDFYSEFQINRAIKCNSDKSGEFSRKKITKKMCDIIIEITK